MVTDYLHCRHSFSKVCPKDTFILILCQSESCPETQVVGHGGHSVYPRGQCGGQPGPLVLPLRAICQQFLAVQGLQRFLPVHFLTWSVHTILFSPSLLLSGEGAGVHDADDGLGNWAAQVWILLMALTCCWQILYLCDPHFPHLITSVPPSENCCKLERWYIAVPRI